MKLVDARQIAALVPMARLLESLGFVVNERTRRAPCLLHSGSNPTAFAWREDGRWHCFSCGMGGDRIALVRAVRRCSFREAIEYLAALAGVEHSPQNIPRAEIERARLALQSLRRDAETLVVLEHVSWRMVQDEVLRLEAICRNTGRRLEALHRGEPERWSGETEYAWHALVMVCQQMPRAAAAYNVASFAPHRDRLAFAVDSKERERLIEEALERGICG
jgi:hypothetical protein